ncbi:MAG TPA: peptide chain release factor N(5)-glutamine methyltransferase [Aestuariivirga sp.]|nr:peptide chain release factor N(5)-glutamine methyltransferase [Aestuariivirga sp.]
MSETRRGLLKQAGERLAAHGIETAILDARLLFQVASDLRHEDIVAEPDLSVPPDVAARFWMFIERRGKFEPVSRILGAREFYGRSFRVTADVLDPRADTETLIGAALALAKCKGPLRILDLGTGSGAIAVTLLAELPEASAVASDLSAAALSVAKGNAEALCVAGRASFVQANWFEGIAGKFDLIVSNPPYIPLGDIAGLAPDVREFDPPRALDGGPDGLEAYRRIADGSGGHLSPKGHVVLEIGAGQENAVNELFTGQGFARESRHFDLSGYVRCLVFARP